MLANLLPGIRDLRTPLAVGYIWLLTLWLWIPTRFKDVAPSTGVPGDLARLAHYSGRLGIGIALSFIAYLIGALSALFNGPLRRIGSFASLYVRWPKFGVRLGYDTYFTMRFIDFWSPPYVEGDDDVKGFARYAMANAQYRSSGLYSLSEVATQATTHIAYSSYDDERYEQKIYRQNKYLAYLIREVYRQGNLLLGTQGELFAAYDRLVAEYEFRIGVTAPLIALIVTLAIRWTPWWLLGLLPLLLLLRTGSERRMQGGDLLADAFRQGRLSIVVPPEYAPNTQEEKPDTQEEKPD
jgi:hypothetical protein